MTQPPGAIPAVDVTDAAASLSSQDATKPILVDVRELDEFRGARVEGAALIPMSSFAQRHAELPKDRPLLVMCASGSRSAAATGFLLRNGWTDVSNVAGGITAWQRAGLPGPQRRARSGRGRPPRLTRRSAASTALSYGDRLAAAPPPSHEPLAHGSYLLLCANAQPTISRMTKFTMPIVLALR